MSFDYDLFVIGGGSGGVRAARVAAGEHGAKVALAEEDRMGGTCVIRGCVPKKLMVYAAGYPSAFEDAAAYGWDAALPALNWARFSANLAAELDRLEAAYRSTLKNAGVTVWNARATLTDPHQIRLSTGESFTARHILIATGGRPERPSIPGAEWGVTSEAMFALPARPASAVILGGGYIACEFAAILAGFGTHVTQLYRGPQILRGFDDELRALVAEGLRARGVDLRLSTDLSALKKTAAGVKAQLSTGESLSADLALFAIGRVPNSGGLGLETLGLTLGPRGEIPVDAYSQTALPSVFAVGDVTGRVTLTPAAIREGHAFADTLFGGKKRAVDYGLVPSAVFTQPELASVGLSEEAAAAQEEVEIYSARFRPMQGHFAGRPDHAFLKLVVSAATRRVLGAHFLAPGAAEMAQMVAIAMNMGATKEDFDHTLPLHPTLAEEMVTLRKMQRRRGPQGLLS